MELTHELLISKGFEYEQIDRTFFIYHVYNFYVNEHNTFFIRRDFWKQGKEFEGWGIHYDDNCLRSVTTYEQVQKVIEAITDIKID